MAHSPAEGAENARVHWRLQLGIGARLDTIQGRQKVRLLDLSQSGAHLVLSRPEQVREGVLTWLRFDNYGALVWQDGEHLGLRFDRLVPLRHLVETRHLAPSVVRDEAMSDELAAREWINGSR